jgi:hypothetical protein
MTPDRRVVRALVREELVKRLAGRGESAHPAFGEIFRGVECSEDPDFPVRQPCVIEPERPCYNSGYCKKLGY